MESLREIHRKIIIKKANRNRLSESLNKASSESQSVRDNEVENESCDGCFHEPRHLLKNVCAECDDFENYTTT